MPKTGSSTTWRIDELAARAGIAVGTVRLYQREGLLPAGHRVGRSMTYGAAHLDRLSRIQQLRAGNFTLTAIKRLIDQGQFVMLDRVLGTDGRPRNRAQLVDETGVDAGLVDALESSGFLAPPAERGAAEYDGGEVTVLNAIAQLLEIGTPPPILTMVLPIYVRHVRALERDLIEAFSGAADPIPGVGSEAVAKYAQRSARHTEAFLYRWDVVVDYLHHRMIQRLVHQARSDRSTAGPVTDATGGTDDAVPVRGR
ncbi:MAG TPA: MerR family transcriptional regulator [Acidimicrobiales bacterium]